MAEDKIRIVATDGDDTITLGFINCGRNYVFGQVTEDGTDPYHYTYHENGYMHLKRGASGPDPNNLPRYYGPPLKNFSGFVSTGSTAVSKKVGRIVSPDFRNDKRGYDNITYIDVRNATHGMMYQAFICEPGFPVAKLIQNMKSNSSVNTDIDPKLSYQIYTEPEPWVGVVHWQQASGILGRLDATPNFRPMGTSVDSRGYMDPYPEPCSNGESGCDGPDGTGPLCIECYEVLNGE